MIKMPKTKTYEINKNAKPFYHNTGSDTAVLFIHGFTDSVGNFKEQIEKVKSLGVSCMGVRLPGHGTHYTDLNNYGPKDWVDCVEDALFELDKNHKKVYVVGISVGGNLALYLAANYPEKVNGVVCIATTTKFSYHNAIKYFVPLLSPFIKYYERFFDERLKQTFLDNGSYEYFPIMTGWRLICFAFGNRPELKNIRAPILLFQVRKKKEAPADGAQYIYDSVGSKIKKIEFVYDYYYERSKDRIFKIASEFLELGKIEDTLKTIPDFFLDSVKKFPKKEALLCKEGSRYVSLNYQELFDEVFHLAYELKKLGVKSGDKVVLISKNRPEWVISDLAIMIAGGVVVPVHEVLTGPQMAGIINEVEAKVAIISRKDIFNKLEKSSASDLKIISMDSLSEKSVDNFETILKAKPADFAKIKNKLLKYLPKEDDLATIVYTSGTTGHFTGVLLTHKNIVTNIKDVLGIFDLSEGEKFLSILPLSHILERTVGYYVQLALGATISYIDDPAKLSEVAMEEKPTIIIAVPRVYEKIYDKVLSEVSKSPVKKIVFDLALKVGGKKDDGKIWKNIFKLMDKIVFKQIKSKFGGNIRFFVSGGAPLPEKVGEFFGKMGVMILEGYGLTETSPIISCNTDKTGHNRFGTAGKVLSSVEAKVSKDGEILVKGPSVTAGYYDRGKTELAFTEDGWFKTGDLGELDMDGFLKIKGRKKEVIVLSTGKNVLPVPVEETIELCPYVKQACVFGDGRKHIAAIIVPEFEELKKEFPDIDEEEIDKNEKVREFIDERIAKVQADLSHLEQVKKYVLISEPFTIENHLFTPTLKLRRHKILEKYADEIEGLY